MENTFYSQLNNKILQKDWNEIYKNRLKYRPPFKVYSDLNEHTNKITNFVDFKLFDYLFEILDTIDWKNILETTAKEGYSYLSIHTDNFLNFYENSRFIYDANFNLLGNKIQEQGNELHHFEILK